jgi:hypothetical protein
MHSMPCWRVLLEGLQLVERERAVRARQLLDCGQRHQCSMLELSCGDVQRRRRLFGSERVLSVPCWCVLLERLQLVERERVVRARQLLDCGQRRECVVQSLPRWSVLSCWVREQQRQWPLRCRQFLCDGEWGQRALRCLSCGRVLLDGLLVVKRQRALSRRQLLHGGQWHQCSMHALPRGNV